MKGVVTSGGDARQRNRDVHALLRGGPLDFVHWNRCCRGDFVFNEGMVVFNERMEGNGSCQCGIKRSNESDLI